MEVNEMKVYWFVCLNTYLYVYISSMIAVLGFVLQRDHEPARSHCFGFRLFDTRRRVGSNKF